MAPAEDEHWIIVHAAPEHMIWAQHVATARVGLAEDRASRRDQLVRFGILDDRYEWAGIVHATSADGAWAASQNLVTAWAEGKRSSAVGDLLITPDGRLLLVMPFGFAHIPIDMNARDLALRLKGAAS